MGLFRNKVIKIREEENEVNKKIAYIDYHKLKPPTDFLSGIIQDLIGNNQCFGIVDTSLAYHEMNIADTREKLHQLLEKQNIKYREIEIKSDYTTRLMGVPIKHDNKKSISYKIGMLLTSSDIVSLLSGNKLNVQFFIGRKDDNQISEELLHRFETARGDMEIIEDSFALQVYVDNFLSILRISYIKDNAEAVKCIMEKHIK